MGEDLMAVASKSMFASVFSIIFLNVIDICEAHRPHDFMFRLVISPRYGLDKQLRYCTDYYLLRVLKSDYQGLSYRTNQTGFSNNKITTLVYFPNYGTDNTIYAGTSNGKIFRSSIYNIWQVIYEAPANIYKLFEHFTKFQ
jgi:hypothetical protein